MNKEPAPKKVYVLELQGDIPSTGGLTIVEIGGTSLDRKTIEDLLVVKKQELVEYLGDEDGEDEDEDEDRGDGEITYGNTDYNSLEWVVAEYDLI